MALAAQEREQITVHLVLMRSREAMGGARVVDVFGAVDEARRFSCGVVYRHDLIVLAVTRAGTSIFFRSSVKSAIPNAAPRF